MPIRGHAARSERVVSRCSASDDAEIIATSTSPLARDGGRFRLALFVTDTGDSQRAVVVGTL